MISGWAAVTCHQSRKFLRNGAVRGGRRGGGMQEVRAKANGFRRCAIAAQGSRWARRMARYRQACCRWGRGRVISRWNRASLGMASSPMKEARILACKFFVPLFVLFPLRFGLIILETTVGRFRVFVFPVRRVPARRSNAARPTEKRVIGGLAFSPRRPNGEV